MHKPVCTAHGVSGAWYYQYMINYSLTAIAASLGKVMGENGNTSPLNYLTSEPSRIVHLL